MAETPDVLDRVQKWAAVEQQNDGAALDPLLADDFVGVGPLGFILKRAEWLVRFDNGLRNMTFAVEDAQVREFGAAAVVIAVLDQQTTFNGRDNSGRFRLTVVAVQHADVWRLAHVHIGNLHNPADGPPIP